MIVRMHSPLSTPFRSLLYLVSSHIATKPNFTVFIHFNRHGLAVFQTYFNNNSSSNKIWYFTFIRCLLGNPRRYEIWNFYAEIVFNALQTICSCLFLFQIHVALISISVWFRVFFEWFFMCALVVCGVVLNFISVWTIFFHLHITEKLRVSGGVSAIALCTHTHTPTHTAQSEMKLWQIHAVNNSYRHILSTDLPEQAFWFIWNHIILSLFSSTYIWAIFCSNNVDCTTRLFLTHLALCKLLQKAVISSHN